MMELKGAVVTAIGEQPLNQAVGGFCCHRGPMAAQLEALAQNRARVLEWKWRAMVISNACSLKC